YNQGIDHVATIVYSHIALQLHRASLPVDLDHTDMRSKRKGTVGGFEATGGLQPGFETGRDAPLRLPVEVGGDKGHLSQGFLPAGVSDDVDGAVAVGHILGPDVQHVGGKLLGFVLDFLDRHLQCCPTHGQATAAKRANAVWDYVRVAVHDL